jgi:hypothetical protein
MIVTDAIKLLNIGYQVRLVHVSTSGEELGCTGPSKKTKADIIA